LLMILGMPIGLGIMMVSPTIVLMMFGEKFIPSGPILAVRGLVLILTYQTMLIGLYFISSDRQIIWTRVMAIAAFATIPLDLLLIPFFERVMSNGAIGGAVAYIFTETAMFSFGVYMLRHEVLNRTSLTHAIRVVLAGLGMVAITWYFRHMFIAIPIIIGMLSYTGLILLFRVITEEDRVILQASGEKLLERIRGAKPQTADLN
jgi:O-antigen/teichoic acid export membrane protein